MSLCLLVTLSATESAEQFKINKIVYVENGADFVELSCGDVPQAAVGIHWFIYNGTEWVKLLKIYKAQPGRNPDPNASTKYGVSKSVNTSLVVRNIKLSDSASFKCGSLGNSTQMRCIRLQVVVPPKTDYRPEFIRGDLKLSSSKDLARPYVENVNEKFTCHIQKVLPGIDSTLFEFYYDGNLRLQSKDGVGQVVENDEPDHTKHIRWEFATFFNRSDNGGKMKCHVNWTAGQYKRPDLSSILSEKVQVKFPPNGMDMEIEEAVKENTEQSVKCTANSANPVSSVGMALFIDETYQSAIESEVTPGSDNDPPEVSVDYTITPAVEYTTRNLTCRISGGNPSDPMSYDYEWTYKPTYYVLAADIPRPYGSYVINGGDTLELKNLGYEDMAGTYMCTVRGVGGQCSGSSTLEVYYAAKLVSKLEEMTVNAVLEASADLIVKFRINPVSNYKVSWFIGDSEVQDTDISNTETGEHVQTTYSISNVTKPQLGNYTVRVINQAIIGEPNEATFIVVLQLRDVSVGLSGLETGILYSVVITLVIAAGIIVAVFIQKNKKKGLKDKSRGGVENEYEIVPTVSHVDHFEEPLGPKPKRKEHPVTNGPVVVDDVPNCAQPNKSAKQAIYGTHATRSKGKIPTGKGKKSRPKPPGHPDPSTPVSDYKPRQSYENVELLNKPISDEEQVVYMNASDAQKQNNPAASDDPTLVYADCTFQHIDPARQGVLPNTEDKLAYASVDFDLTKAYTLYDNL